MAQTGEWGINRADHEFDAPLLQRQHLRVAKCLRYYWVSRIQITEPHSLELPITDYRLLIGFGFHHRIETAQCSTRRPENRLFGFGVEC